MPPVNRIDALCKQHDIDYANIRTPLDVLDADLKAMTGVFNVLSDSPSWSEFIWSGIGFSIYYGLKRPLEKMGMLSPLFFTNTVKLSEDYMEQLDRKIESLLDDSIPSLMKHILDQKIDIYFEKMSHLGSLTDTFEDIRAKVFQEEGGGNSQAQEASQRRAFWLVTESL